MPYLLTVEDGIFRLTLSGEVTEADFRGFADELIRLESTFAETPSRLSDLSLATAMQVRYADVAVLVDRRKSQTFPNNFKSAIVAPQPVHFGFARMFQTLNDHPQIAIRIFGDCAAALAWIKGEPAGGTRS